MTTYDTWKTTELLEADGEQEEDDCEHEWEYLSNGDRYCVYCGADSDE